MHFKSKLIGLKVEVENKLAKLTRHVYKPGVRKAFSEFGDQLNGLAIMGIFWVRWETPRRIFHEI